MDDFDFFDFVYHSKNSVNRISHPSLPKLDFYEFLDDDQFYRIFRMTKISFDKLLNLIHEEITWHDRRNSLTPPKIQLLATLRYYATGTFQQVQDLLGLTQPTISRIVERVSQAIAKLS